MKHIFYFLSIGPIMWELYNVTAVSKVHAYSKKIKTVKWEKSDSQYKSFIFCLMVYMLWSFVGLFSEQWPLFATIILMGIVFPKKFIVLRWLDALVTLLILFFILLNAYHFHVDVWKYILKSLNIR